MSQWVSRSGWGARPPDGSYNTLASKPKGHAIHWEGPTMGVPDHSKCDDTVRSIQNYHMDSQGWSDVAYNILVCQHGYMYEGRGKGNGSAANGTSQANKDWYAICALCGEGDPISDELVAGLQDAGATCRDWGAADGSTGHRDHYATACPGDELYAMVQAGAFRATGTPGGGTPTPAPPSGGGKVPTFPLPAGHYFGPKEGPQESHSGYYSDTDRDNLADWQTQMEARGWAITPDGLYGPETDGVATAFQQEKGLDVDGLIGPDTWGAAWTAPIT